MAVRVRSDRHVAMMDALHRFESLERIVGRRCGRRVGLVSTSRGAGLVLEVSAAVRPQV